MSCVMRASAAEWNPEDFAATTTLKIICTYRRGEPKGPGSEKLNENSGLNIEVSTADFEEFERQKEEAIVFLQNNREELKRLKLLLDSAPEAMLELDFGTVNRELPAQSEVIPARLLSLAGELGISIRISKYVIDNQE